MLRHVKIGRSSEVVVAEAQAPDEWRLKPRQRQRKVPARPALIPRRSHYAACCCRRSGVARQVHGSACRRRSAGGVIHPSRGSWRPQQSSAEGLIIKLRVFHTVYGPLNRRPDSGSGE